MPSEQGQMSAHGYFQEVAQNGLEMEAKMKVEKPRICLISDLITIDTLNWEILCCGRLFFAWQDVYQHPGALPLHASSTCLLTPQPPIVTIIMSADIAKGPWRVKNKTKKKPPVGDPLTGLGWQSCLETYQATVWSKDQDLGFGNLGEVNQIKINQKLTKFIRKLYCQRNSQQSCYCPTLKISPWTPTSHQQRSGSWGHAAPSKGILLNTHLGRDQEETRQRPSQAGENGQTHWLTKNLIPLPRRRVRATPDQWNMYTVRTGKSPWVSSPFSLFRFRVSIVLRFFFFYHWTLALL